MNTTGVSPVVIVGADADGEVESDAGGSSRRRRVVIVAAWLPCRKLGRAECKTWTYKVSPLVHRALAT